MKWRCAAKNCPVPSGPNTCGHADTGDRTHPGGTLKNKGEHNFDLCNIMIRYTQVDLGTMQESCGARLQLFVAVLAEAQEEAAGAALCKGVRRKAQ